MKYIRTKDTRNVKRYAKVKLEEWEGIVLIDLDKEKFEVARYDDYTKPEWLMNGENYGDIPFSRIIKTADTIEELVDEYVRVHKTFNNMSMVCDKELAISSSKYPKHYDVYGSIWVDGELHKVAKVNEKGELELL